MNSRMLLAVVAALVLLLAGVMTGPAFSGEHPWDSDRTDGSKGPIVTQTLDTLDVTLDSVGTVTVVTGTASAPLPLWVSVVTTAWAVVMSM